MVENRLARFNEDRDRVLNLVTERVVASRVSASRGGGDASLEYVLNDVAYAEMTRLAGQADRKSRARYGKWHDLAASLGTMSEGDKRQRLHELVEHYARDVVGNFDPRVYRFASGLMPTFLGVAFTPMKLSEGVSGLERLASRVQVQGPLETVRAHFSRGTVIVTPTHSSNMDSIVLGFGLEQSGLPPVTYGAGKNLFSNRLIGFFMHNLGAYRVDRRLRFALYKDVLKEYSTVLLELGYHSLFFPGGTRCRSNEVEPRLKLGLLGTGVQAYQNNLRAGRPDSRVYVVPVTINYHLVLEAETLIGDYLAEVGKSRYIIVDDEFSRLGRIVEFLRRTLSLEESVVLRFGDAFDPFGNQVDDDGESLDSRGRRVDPASYVQDANGNVAEDRQRDMEYTRELGESLRGAFRKETVFLTTHLAARALYDGFVERARTRDIYRLLRVGGRDTEVPVDEACARIDRLRDAIAARPEVGRVHERVCKMAPAEILDDALGALGIYHTRQVARRVGDVIRVEDKRLLYYYRNRTAHLESC